MVQVTVPPAMPSAAKDKHGGTCRLVDTYLY
jgi:hypothetical protein